MPARRAKKKTTIGSPATHAPRKKSLSGVAELKGLATSTLDRYGAPGAAVLASGAAIAAAIAFRDPIGRMASAALRSLVSGGTAAGEAVASEINLDALLRRAGLRRRRRWPFVTGLAILGGVAAASALAAWVLPILAEVPAGDATVIPGTMPFSPSADPRPVIDGAA